MENASNTAFPVEKSEEVQPGIFVEWYSQGRIVGYRITTVTLRNVDQWAEIVLKTLREWDPGKPYLALHDLSTSGVALQYASVVNFDFLNIGITPAQKLVAEDAFNQHPMFRARVAVNFNLSFSGRMGKVLTSTLLDSHPSIGYKTFYNRDKALAWLAASLETPQPDSSGG